MVNHYLRFAAMLACGDPFLTGAVCDPFQRFWPVCPSSQVRRPGPTAGFSSFPTRRTATGSTSALPRARNAAPTPPSSIVSRGILRWPPPIGGLTPTKSPVQFRREANIAVAPAAANTSPSPASAEPGSIQSQRRLGNDVTPPREAGKEAGNSPIGGFRPQSPALPRRATVVDLTWIRRRDRARMSEPGHQELPSIAGHA